MLQFDLHRHAAHPIAGLSQIASNYDVILCDVWGVVHNGTEHYPDAAHALTRFREGGGTVVLITNAPRPCEQPRADAAAASCADGGLRREWSVRATSPCR